MGVQKITFDGASISAKIDADLYHFLLSSKIGILSGIKNSVSFTLSNNTITFQDGYIAVYGRLIYIENNTQISVSPDSSKSGYVILGVNTSSNEVTIYLKEQTGSYPSLTRTNLLNTAGLFEFVLCAYTKTTTSVQLNLSYQREVITSSEAAFNAFKQQLISDLEPKVYTPTFVSSGVYRLSDLNSAILMRSIIYAIVGSSTVVVIPGHMIFIILGSYTSVSYTHNGSNYSMYISYNQGNLTLTCGLTTHNITRIILHTF